MTVTGRFFTTDAALVNVFIGRFPCVIYGLEQLETGSIQIKCRSGPSGVVEGGKKHVTVTVRGNGASIAADDFAFLYIDAWSAVSTCKSFLK